MALERGLTCPWSPRSEIKSRSSFQALTPPLTFKLEKLGRTFPRTILRTALCSSRGNLEGGQEGGQWPVGSWIMHRPTSGSSIFPHIGNRCLAYSLLHKETEFPFLPFSRKGLISQFRTLAVLSHPQLPSPFLPLTGWGKGLLRPQHRPQQKQQA